MGVIIYNGLSSKDFGIVVEHPPNYELPERNYDTYHVPGRNGDVIVDLGSYNNVDRSYEIAVGDLDKWFPEMAMKVSAWLHSGSGYARLEDSYEASHYRLASYHESVSIENILFHGGRATIHFNCKPQRFLKAGDKKRTFKKAGIIHNPTSFSSEPIITVYGTGSGVLVIGGYTVTISDIGSTVVINSELQDAYKGAENRNPYVTLSSNFPRLVPGDNRISFSGGITSVEVIPKWWTL